MLAVWRIQMFGIGAVGTDLKKYKPLWELAHIRAVQCFHILHIWESVNSKTSVHAAWTLKLHTHGTSDEWHTRICTNNDVEPQSANTGVTRFKIGKNYLTEKTEVFENSEQKSKKNIPEFAVYRQHSPQLHPAAILKQQYNLNGMPLWSYAKAANSD